MSSPPGTRALALVLLVASCHDEFANGPGVEQRLLPASDIPQFAQALPTLSLAGGTMDTVTGNQPLTIRMCEVWSNVLPPGTFRDDEQPRTRVFAYVAGEACPANGRNDPAIDTFIGPVIVNVGSAPPAAPPAPTTVTWVNELGTTSESRVLAYTRATDPTIHWANPNGLHCGHEDVPKPGSPCAKNYDGPIPAVVHLHGADVPPELDGGPDAWFLSEERDGYATRGPGYYSGGDPAPNEAIYAYPNVQGAAPLWFHDHTLGVTNLGVYAGLAGLYLITDPTLDLPQGLTPTGLVGPGGSDAPLIPLVIQDRAFDTEGRLFNAVDTTGGTQYAPNPQHPYWAPEVFLDVNVVNGKVWPYLEVEPKRYRFLVLDGANARAYQLSLVDEATGAAGPPIAVIGSDDGYNETPTILDPQLGASLFVMPGERYDVIVDFSGIAPGTNLILTNTAAAPYPGGDAPDEATSGRVMQFRVGPCTSGACGADDPSYDPALGGPLVPPLTRYANPNTGELLPGVVPDAVRQLTLNEIVLDPSTATNPANGQRDTHFPGGSHELLLNNTSWTGDSPRSYDDFTAITVGGQTTFFSELPQEGHAELWELVNLTEDEHPIHTHLTDLQIVNRQTFDVDAYNAAYAAAFPGDATHGPGTWIPGFGPPLDYATGNPSALGGNPDVTPFLTGGLQPPDPQEAGWKDVVTVPPGSVTRIIVRYAPSELPVDAPAEDLFYPFAPDDDRGYVWHCHILNHEDNEMMRPFAVSLNPAAPPPDERPIQAGRDY